MIYYFAKIGDDNFVTEVHSILDEFCTDENGDFSESMAIDYLNNFFGESRWIRTYKFNDEPIRYNSADPGSYYYEEFDAFIPARPEGDYVLTETFRWMPVDLTEFLESVEVF